jgi:peptidoglycan-associated lipoprotein
MYTFLIFAACNPYPANTAASPPVLPEPAMKASDTELYSLHVVQVERNLQRVQFETGTATLTDDGRRALEANAAILRESPDVHVLIQGHADERGDAADNLELGMARAKAVREMLVANEVAPEQLMVATYGERLPLVEGARPAVWSVNRRAEFRVTLDPDAVVDGSIDNPVDR